MGDALARQCLLACARVGGASLAALYRIDHQARPADFQLLGLATPMHQSYLERYQGSDPLHPRHCQNLAIDLVPLRLGQAAQAAGSRERYAGFLARHGICDVVEIFARQAGQAVLGLSLLRQEAEGAFSAGELERLQGLQAMLALALPRLATHSASVGLTALTPRERELAELLRAGHGNKRLAQLLGIGLPTVKTHLINLYRKVGVANRTELVTALFL
ncbi:helix-turn-helix transcriptional regulator [Pseudomonas oryzihabitans]|uniref:helix-turn-helix transcriptional regulator n=1 Tax=Pseudomonas oryzihabitans TaxID=47885 RepID=UPI00214EA499|nr:helix-turn-helix transcriptional regulator [Pseudomonas psychrotolerans]UUW72702.1 helix-turn-helix transcriptional regulator [Pseudomonas psychrotolerans]